ncbi:MAG: hypothetical protein PWP31_934 [Clostridia bacterium]|nr:hypothetical protein [Clostridia bacterium]
MRFDELTKQRHLETSLAQLALIVESTSDAIIGMTLDGIITSWNNGAEKIYGYSATEMVGSYIFPLFPSEKRIKQIFKDILKGELSTYLMN